MFITRVRYFNNDGVLESDPMEGLNGKQYRVRLNGTKYSVLDQDNEAMMGGEGKTSAQAKIKAKEALKNLGVVFGSEKRVKTPAQ